MTVLNTGAQLAIALPGNIVTHAELISLSLKNDGS
jgi:hypothetical protein